MRYSSALALALLTTSAFAQAPQINDVQLRPGSTALWGAAFNVNNNQDIAQYNTAGSTVDSFRWFQGSSIGSAIQLFTIGTTGAVFGPSGSRMGAGTVNAAGFFQNGVPFGGTPGGTNGQIQYNNAGAFGGFTTSGDATINTASGALTLSTVNSNVGTWGSATLCGAVTVNAKGLITAAAQSACTPAIANVTGLGAGVGTFLATPSSANLAAAVTGETGTGALVFATSPALVTPALGTPASGTLTNTTGFPTANLAGAGAGVLTWLATPSSANLIAALTDETGTGAAVFASSPALAGTPTAPTAAAGTATTQIATTAFVSAASTATTQVFLSGSGTYNRPANVKWLEVELCGGGGGGAGSGTTPGNGGAGGNTTFSTFTGNGGAGAVGAALGAGGTATGGYQNRTGGSGQAGSGANITAGGNGGISPFGGAGWGGAPGAGAGVAASVNSCSGGGGGGVNTTINGGGGGGSGGYLRGIILAPGATFSYGVGAAGTAGTTGTNGAAGGAGGSGYLQVIEHY